MPIDINGNTFNKFGSRLPTLYMERILILEDQFEVDLAMYFEIPDKHTANGKMLNKQHTKYLQELKKVKGTIVVVNDFNYSRKDPYISEDKVWAKYGPIEMNDGKNTNLLNRLKTGEISILEIAASDLGSGNYNFGSVGDTERYFAEQVLYLGPFVSMDDPGLAIKPNNTSILWSEKLDLRPKGVPGAMWDQEIMIRDDGSEVLRCYRTINIVDNGETMWGPLGMQMYIDNAARGDIDVTMCAFTTAIESYPNLTSAEKRILHERGGEAQLLYGHVSDIIYEQISVDGALNPVPVETWRSATGQIMDGNVVQAIDYRYFSNPANMNAEIKATFSDLIGTTNDESLQLKFDNLAYILEVHGDDPDILIHLNEFKKSFFETSTATAVGRLHEKVEIRLYNANNAAKRGTEVVKFFNLTPTVIDGRRAPPIDYVFETPPYNEDYDPRRARNYIYVDNAKVGAYALPDGREWDVEFLEGEAESMLQMGMDAAQTMNDAWDLAYKAHREMLIWITDRFNDGQSNDTHVYWEEMEIDMYGDTNVAEHLRRTTSAMLGEYDYDSSEGTITATMALTYMNPLQVFSWLADDWTAYDATINWHASDLKSLAQSVSFNTPFSSDTPSSAGSLSTRKVGQSTQDAMMGMYGFEPNRWRYIGMEQLPPGSRLQMNVLSGDAFGDTSGDGLPSTIYLKTLAMPWHKFEAVLREAKFGEDSVNIQNIENYLDSLKGSSLWMGSLLLSITDMGLLDEAKKERGVSCYTEGWIIKNENCVSFDNKLFTDGFNDLMDNFITLYQNYVNATITFTMMAGMAEAYLEASDLGEDLDLAQYYSRYNTYLNAFFFFDYEKALHTNSHITKLLPLRKLETFFGRALPSTYFTMARSSVEKITDEFLTDTAAMLNREEENFHGRYDAGTLEEDYLGTGYLSDPGIRPYSPTKMGKITSFYSGWEGLASPSAVSAPIKSVLHIPRRMGHNAEYGSGSDLGGFSTVYEDEGGLGYVTQEIGPLGTAQEREYVHMFPRSHQFPSPDADNDYRLILFDFQAVDGPFAANVSLEAHEAGLQNSDAQQYNSTHGIYQPDTIANMYVPEVVIRDSTDELFKQWINTYQHAMELFNEYYEMALEECNYNSDSQELNKFFVDKVIEMHSDEPHFAPWYYVPIIWHTHLDVMTAQHSGNKEEILRAALKDTERIHPKNARLHELAAWQDKINSFYERLYEPGSYVTGGGGLAYWKHIWALYENQTGYIRYGGMFTDPDITQGSPPTNQEPIEGHHAIIKNVPKPVNVDYLGFSAVTGDVVTVDTDDLNKDYK